MEPEKKSNGALVGLVVVVIILIIGGLYMWQADKDTTPAQDTTNTVGQTNTTQSEALGNQDAAALDALDQDAQTTDAEAGVDVNAVN